MVVGAESEESLFEILRDSSPAEAGS